MKRPHLDVLRDIAREDAAARADDDAWIRRAAGALSPEEEAEILARAGSSEEAALLHRATAPVAADRMDELLARAERAAASAPEAPRDRVAAARRASPAPSRMRAVLMWSGPILAAAALILWIRARAPEATALPEYAVVVGGVDVQQRGVPSPALPSATAPASERQAASAGAWLTIVARPAERVPVPVAVAAFVVRGAETRQVPILPRVSESGTVTLEGTREALFGDARGPVDLVVWIGPRASLPVTAGAAREGTSAPSVRRIVVPLDLR
jgi:hypothetical protein